MERRKWFRENWNARVGDRVLIVIVDENTKWGEWPIGTITKVYPNSAGNVRQASIKTSMTEYKRPVTKLCLISESPKDWSQLLGLPGLLSTRLQAATGICGNNVKARQRKKNQQTTRDKDDSRIWMFVTFLRVLIFTAVSLILLSSERNILVKITINIAQLIVILRCVTLCLLMMMMLKIFATLTFMVTIFSRNLFDGV